jgi:hypothetical protein
MDLIDDSRIGKGGVPKLINKPSLKLVAFTLFNVCCRSASIKYLVAFSSIMMELSSNLSSI